MALRTSLPGCSEATGRAEAVATFPSLDLPTWSDELDVNPNWPKAPAAPTGRRVG